MKQTPDRKKGFTMLEMMVVIAIFSILALMAIPLTITLIPNAKVRSEAMNMATIMRQARLRAANTQRPTRILVDCRAHLQKKPNPAF